MLKATLSKLREAYPYKFELETGDIVFAQPRKEQPSNDEKYIQKWDYYFNNEIVKVNDITKLIKDKFITKQIP